MSDKAVTKSSLAKFQQVVKIIALSLLLLPVAGLFVWGGMNYSALAFGFGTLLTIFISIPSKEERQEERLTKLLEANETLLNTLLPLDKLREDDLTLTSKGCDADCNLPEIEAKVLRLEMQLKKYEERLNDYQITISELEELGGRLLDTVQEDYKALHWKEVNKPHRVIKLQ